MNMKSVMLGGVLVTFIAAGCFVPGRHGGVTLLVPALPSVVVLETEPYYVQGGYHYHYQNNRWYYANSRNGPWSSLPKDRYPKEVRFRDGGPGRDGDRNPPGHGGR